MEKSTGARLKGIRGTRTQQDFADLLGISRKTLIRYESDERSPDVDLILKLNVLFKVQPLWLLAGIGDASGGELLSADEHLLLNLYRRMEEVDRKAFFRVGERMTSRTDEMQVTVPEPKNLTVSETRPTSRKKGTFVKRGSSK